MGALCSSEDDARAHSGGRHDSDNAPTPHTGSKGKKGSKNGGSTRPRTLPRASLESFVRPFGKWAVPGEDYRVWLRASNNNRTGSADGNHYGKGRRAPVIDFDWDEFPARIAGVREICRDGNCFYTSFLLGIAEYLATLAPVAAASATTTTTTTTSAALAAPHSAATAAAAAAAADTLLSSYADAMATAAAEGAAVGALTPVDTSGFLSFLRACAEGKYLPGDVAAAVDGRELERAVQALRVRLALEMHGDMANVLPFLACDDDDDGDVGGNDFSSPAAAAGAAAAGGDSVAGDGSGGSSGAGSDGWGFHGNSNQRGEGEDPGDYFLRTQVLRMGASADSLQIVYTAQILPIGVRIERAGAGAGAGGGGRADVFPPGIVETGGAVVVLLHTPGHFELAYLKPPGTATAAAAAGPAVAGGEEDKEKKDDDEDAAAAAAAAAAVEWPVVGGPVYNGVPASAYAVSQAVMAKQWGSD